MSPTATPKTTVPESLDPRVLPRTLEEGYGPGAWHGPDLRAALDDVDDEAAFWRPSPSRRNIAEIVLHHAFCVRGVRGQLGGGGEEPFVLEGADWFELNPSGPLSWSKVRETVESEQQALVKSVGSLGSGRGDGSPGANERFDLVLGITCHAVYHAGQIQLLKRLREG